MHVLYSDRARLPERYLTNTDREISISRSCTQLKTYSLVIRSIETSQLFEYRIKNSPDDLRVFIILDFAVRMKVLLLVEWNKICKVRSSARSDGGKIVCYNINHE